jgi:hypothetical protein
MELAGGIMMTYAIFIIKHLNEGKNTQQLAALDSQGGTAVAS